MKVVTSKKFQEVFDRPGSYGWGDANRHGCAVCKLFYAMGLDYPTFTREERSVWYSFPDPIRGLGTAHDRELRDLEEAAYLSPIDKTMHPKSQAVHEKYLKLVFQKAEELGLIHLEDDLAEELRKYIMVESTMDGNAKVAVHG
jgi:hypothetical protein